MLRVKLATLEMMLTLLQLPSVHNIPSCDECERDAEENRMRKESLCDKTWPWELETLSVIYTFP